jgi:hypothetical protein
MKIHTEKQNEKIWVQFGEQKDDMLVTRAGNRTGKTVKVDGAGENFAMMSKKEDLS